MAIKVTLGVSGMDKNEFNAWHAYVEEHVGRLTGLVVEVDRLRFMEGSEDTVVGATTDETKVIRNAIRELWDALSPR